MWKVSELNYFYTTDNIYSLEKSDEWLIWFHIFQVELEIGRAQRWPTKELTEEQPHYLKQRVDESVWSICIVTFCENGHFKNVLLILDYTFMIIAGRGGQ